MAVMHPELIMKSIIPVVMAGIIAIYGLVVSVLIANGMSTPTEYPLFRCVPTLLYHFAPAATYRAAHQMQWL